MSESSPAAATVAPVAAPAVEAAVDPAAAGVAWEGLMAQMAKQPGFPGGMGGVPFSMPFPQPFMYPFMLPGMPGGFGLPGAEGEVKECEGSGEDETEDEEDEEAGDSSGKEGGRPKRKRAARSAKKPKVGPDGVVKSNSSAALAMLAGAAANKGPAAAAAAAAAAAMQQGGMMSEHLLGMFNGTAGGMVGAGGQIDLSKLTAEQQQQLQMLAPAAYEPVGDEREVKKMRRKQSNRESARRSRLRKQAECEQLGRQVKDLLQDNARLKEDKMQLLAQIEILNAKLSMSSAFGAVHALGPGDLEKMQADMRAKQTQDMQNMAAAMAQAMQVNGGGMMGAGMGLPTLDVKALEEGGEEAAAAAAAAAAAMAASALPMGLPAAAGVGEGQEQEGDQ